MGSLKTLYPTCADDGGDGDSVCMLVVLTAKDTGARFVVMTVTRRITTKREFELELPEVARAHACNCVHHGTLRLRGQELMFEPAYLAVSARTRFLGCAVTTRSATSTGETCP